MPGRSAEFCRAGSIMSGRSAEFLRTSHRRDFDLSRIFLVFHARQSSAEPGGQSFTPLRQRRVPVHFRILRVSALALAQRLERQLKIAALLLEYLVQRLLAPADLGFREPVAAHPGVVDAMSVADLLAYSILSIK